MEMHGNGHRTIARKIIVLKVTEKIWNQNKEKKALREYRKRSLWRLNIEPKGESGIEQNNRF